MKLMIVGCTLDYCIICDLFMKLMTKGKGDYIYSEKNDNKYNINNNKMMVHSLVASLT